MRIKLLFKDMLRGYTSNWETFSSLFLIVGFAMLIGASIMFGLEGASEATQSNARILALIGFAVMSAGIPVIIGALYKVLRKPALLFYVKYLASERQMPKYLNDEDEKIKEIAKKILKKEDL